MNDTARSNDQLFDIEKVSIAADAPALFAHQKRSEWGLGIVLHREPDRLRVQFQDGRARKFKRGYYHFFEPVDRRLDVAQGIADALRTMAGEAPAARKSADKVVTLDEQIAHFTTQHEAGFVSEEYVDKHRGTLSKRRLKRHRDGLIDIAASLTERTLSRLSPAEVHERWTELVSATDLIRVPERKRVAAMSEDHFPALKERLIALLHGRAPFVARFDAFVRFLEAALDAPPSWALATLPAAAAHPAEHVVVRRLPFARQSKFMAPGLVIPDRPMAILYTRLLGISTSVRTALEEAGMPPRDLFDVSEFMQLTLKPAVQREILASRPAPADAAD